MICTPVSSTPVALLCHLCGTNVSVTFPWHLGDTKVAPHRFRSMEPTGNHGASDISCLRLSPSRLANGLCAIASCCIILSLSLTHFNPRRFRIHPIPYLSDAGIRDPERIIISFGCVFTVVFVAPVEPACIPSLPQWLSNCASFFRLPWSWRASMQSLSLTSALFVPVGAMYYLYMRERVQSFAHAPRLCVPCFFLPQRRFTAPSDRLVSWALPSALLTSFFLALFTAIPGIMIFHHVFAFFFAASAAVWCTISTMFAHACADAEGDLSPGTWRLLKIKYSLCVVQILSWVSFGVLWILLKLGIPWKLVPNKDSRFVWLALFEYFATSALLSFIHITASNDLTQKFLCVSLIATEKIV